MAIRSTYCLEVKPNGGVTNICDWRDYKFSDQLGAPCGTVSGVRILEHIVGDREWRRGRYQTELHWGKVAPKKGSKKNSILLRSDALAVHDREETFESSPLDKQCARYMAALFRSRLRQQRLATVSKARQEAARASSAHEEVAEEVLVEDPPSSCDEDALSD